MCLITFNATGVLPAMPKKALIFGHTSGLGLSLTKSFLAKGYDIIGVSRSTSSIESNRITSLQTDLAQKSDLETLISTIRRDYADFDVLVYAAGTLTSHDFDKINYDDMEYVYRVNTFAPMLLESHLLDLIKQNETYVVNITSSTLILKYPEYAEYASSKAAFSKFTKDLHAELLPTGARVMDVCPAGFTSGIYAAMSGDHVERNENEQMNPDDIAELISTIVSLPKNIELPYVFINRKQSMTGDE